MKKEDHLSIDLLWDNLLSREPEKIRPAFIHLSQSECSAVIEHLNRMISEDGWHPEQKKSASIALQIIGKFTKGIKQK